MSDKFLKRRRLFLKGLALVGVGSLAWPLLKKKPPLIFAKGAPAELSHKIYTSDFPKPTKFEKNQVVIIGSGIAGLAAARSLRQNGITDFVILELEDKFGGNSAWGENSVGAYPWAAHYLPIPSIESEFLFDFLKEANVITGFDDKGAPFYNELYLCHDLKERLYINGLWQEGLIPNHGVPEIDQAEIDRFFKLMEFYKQAIGDDNLAAFSIPLDVSSKDKKYLALDKITMAHFLVQNNFHSGFLKWYVDHCMRDDYGADSGTISAWAGVHYFASRRSRSANSESDAILTWPEGNGFLSKKMADPFLDKIKTNALVYKINSDKNKYQVNYFDSQTNVTTQINANAVIMATPRFVAQKLQSNVIEAIPWSYSPWLVANITLKSIPLSKGAPLAWDNVSFYSRSLGYVHSQHQSLQTLQNKNIITYYYPLDHNTPRQSRLEALNAAPSFWQQTIINDLKHIHPEIEKEITNIDYRILAHGMCRPTPGIIWGQSRIGLKRAQDGLFFAHSDMSGISIFEEAFYQGLQTAKEVLHFLR